MSTQPVRYFGEDLVNCSICFDTFKDAKVLPCLHSFCQTCITRHYEVYKLKNGNRLSCPSCREMLPVPKAGVAGLRNDQTTAKTKDLLNQVNIVEFTVLENSFADVVNRKFKLSAVWRNLVQKIDRDARSGFVRVRLEIAMTPNPDICRYWSRIAANAFFS